ncbi:MAG: glycosyltransferase family 39 protein [Deltaproteobacteria bacterium]|nr:glycosyltransferase family 39 protein [Deltaproteobacteria bacterium]
MPPFFGAIFSKNKSHPNEYKALWGICLIFTLALIIRLFASQHTHIINPDGVYYIHQARALYHGEWPALTACHLSFVSIYPFLIAGAYPICHQWIMAAQIVSIFFGTITLIPLYLLCRRFFDRTVSAMTLLVFALLPFFVAGSASVIRGPVCWFFLTLGLYLFLGVEENRRQGVLLLASLSFLMASWARIESILFILVGGVYLMVVPQEKRFYKLFFFLLPLISALTIILCTALFLNKPLEQTLRLSETINKFSAPLVAYESLRSNIAGLMSRFSPNDVMPHFLHKTRNMVWLVALGTLVKYMVRAYFYVFFILLIIGIGKTWHGLRTDRRILYLSLTALSALLLLYLHMLQTWMMFDRFWAIFMLPACVVMGFGLEKIIAVFRSKFRLKQSSALYLMCFLILVFALPKDLKPKATDKIVFKSIGEFVAAREPHFNHPVKILKSDRSPNWIPFYANLHYQGAPCPSNPKGLKEMASKTYASFVGNLRRAEIGYFLYEERYWPSCQFDFLAQCEDTDFMRLGAWHHQDTGKMVLYRVLDKDLFGSDR